MADVVSRLLVGAAGALASRSTRRSMSCARASRHDQPAGRRWPSSSLTIGSSGSRPATSSCPSGAAQAMTSLSTHQSATMPLASSGTRAAWASTGHSEESSNGMPSCSDSTGSRDSSDSAPRRTRMLPIRPPNCCWNASALPMSAGVARWRSTNSSPSLRNAGDGVAACGEAGGMGSRERCGRRRIAGGTGRLAARPARFMPAVCAASDSSADRSA